jgi:seryl-tRNA synthetase
MQITNPKIVKLLTDKDELVKLGRETSKKLEKLEYKIKILEDKEKAITAKVEPTELGDKAEALKKEINDKIKEFEKIASDIVKEKLNAIPKDIEEKHKALLKEKEQVERDRNKIALKVQKIKDKVVPMIKKEVEPTLKEFEDLESANIKNGVVDVRVFSHLEEFKAQYKKANPTK